MREPHYQFTNLQNGAIAASTVVKPRLAPSLYGTSLLEAVPESAIAAVSATQNGEPSGEPASRLYKGMAVVGRFGWQCTSVSLRDQTTKAFAREMGLTSNDQPVDDCVACADEPLAADPVISDESLSAVLAYLSSLQAPRSPASSQQHLSGLDLFINVGCAACHRPELPLDLHGTREQDGARAGILAYTDLRLHDLGTGLADRTAAGIPVVSKWRTSPLWGLSNRTTPEGSTSLMHDGRARSVEEAVLWHSGEARRARLNFENLPVRRRISLLHWLESL
jgi:CxxC motif-containing protein (DUF1111 family)